MVVDLATLPCCLCVLLRALFVFGIAMLFVSCAMCVVALARVLGIVAVVLVGVVLAIVVLVVVRVTALGRVSALYVACGPSC